MTTFADIRPEQIRFDCRYYTGYKPCHRNDACPGCTEYAPRGTEILVIKLGAMGDVLRTKCILPGLKRRYPTSWITWVTAKGNEPIVRDPLVDEIRTYSGRGRGALEGRRFHVLICLDKDPEAIALSRTVQAGRKYGYKPTDFNTVAVWNEGALHALRMGLSDELKYRQNNLTHLQILYDMMEIEYKKDKYRVSISEEARAKARAIIERAGRRAGSRPLIAINTGCGPAFQTKQWTTEGFVELAERLTRGAQRDLFMEDARQSADADVLLVGGPREKELHKTIMEQVGALAGRRVFDSGTDNSLEVFFALIDASDLVVTADTMALHVGVALEKPVVAFFGPTASQEVDLFDRGEKIVTDYQCSPCYLKECDVRPSCMMALTADTVEGAVLRQLALHKIKK